MFFRRKTAGVEWLIAGLGNPGRKYEGTRHNAGFAALDSVAETWGIAVKRSRFDALCGEGAVQGNKVLLLKPQTFMNLSGKSILQATQYYKLLPRRVLVLCDDVALAPGVLRIRTEGSDGGHNGLKSIITFIGQGFPRVRIGVGDKPHPGYDMADWVLSRLSTAEEKLISARHADIAGALLLLMEDRPDEAMSRYNGAAK